MHEMSSFHLSLHRTASRCGRLGQSKPWHGKCLSRFLPTVTLPVKSHWQRMPKSIVHSFFYLVVLCSKHECWSALNCRDVSRPPKQITNTKASIILVKGGLLDFGESDIAAIWHGDWGDLSLCRPSSCQRPWCPHWLNNGHRTYSYTRRRLPDYR